MLTLFQISYNFYNKSGRADTWSIRHPAQALHGFLRPVRAARDELVEAYHAIPAHTDFLPPLGAFWPVRAPDRESLREQLRRRAAASQWHHRKARVARFREYPAV